MPQIKNNINEIFHIRNETETSADLYFYGDIVSDRWSAWSDEDQYPEAIQQLLKGQEGKDLNIYINSGGGDVFAGMAIYNIIKRHIGFKTVYVDGLAASIASVIAMAGDKLVMPKNAFLMIHKPWSFVIGNANDMLKEIELLNAIEQSIVNIYAEHLADNVDTETIAKMVDAETWLTGEQAAEYFSVDVAAEKQIAACTNARFKNQPKNLVVVTTEREKNLSAKSSKIKSLCISGILKGE